jgi:acetyltransferase
LSADPDGERAEFAIVVEDSMTGKGIGRKLMNRIIDYAATRGLREIFGFVLGENAVMLDLCRRLGFHIDAAEREGVLRVSLDPLHR